MTPTLSDMIDIAISIRFRGEDMGFYSAVCEKKLLEGSTAAFSPSKVHRMGAGFDR